MDHNLKKYRTKSRQLELDKEKYFVVKVCVIAMCITNFLFMLKDTISGNYKDKREILVYWVVWAILVLLILFSHYKDRPHLVRIINLLIIVRNIIPLFNLGDRKSFDDPVQVINFSLIQNISFQVMIVSVCVTEKYYIHIPLSIIFQLFISFG